MATTCLKLVKILRGKKSKVQVHQPERLRHFWFCIDCFWISSKEILGNKWAPSNDKLMSDSKIIAWKAKDKSNSLEILFLIHYYIFDSKDYKLLKIIKYYLLLYHQRSIFSVSIMYVFHVLVLLWSISWKTGFILCVYHDEV